MVVAMIPGAAAFMKMPATRDLIGAESRFSRSGRAGAEWRITTPGLNIIEEISITQPIVLFRPDNFSDGVGRHPILDADEQAIHFQIGLYNWHAQRVS
jgi:hypothetical protein